MHSCYFMSPECSWKFQDLSHIEDTVYLVCASVLLTEDYRRAPIVLGVSCRCCAILAYASCVEVQPRCTSRGIADKRKDKVDPVELAETSQALMRVGGTTVHKS